LIASRTRTRTVHRSDGPEVHLRWSDARDGDFHRTDVTLPELEPRRRALVDLPWTMLDERHGIDVVRVTSPGEHDGEAGDVAVTRVCGAVLGCWVGDCAPVVLVGATCELAVVHAGWRGLAAGVIDAAFDAIGEPVVGAYLGPCIGPCCYEFGADDLRAVATGVHVPATSIAGTTTWGTAALDVAAAVDAACASRGVTVERVGACTGCTYPGFSHRVRSDPQRHVMAAWQGAAPDGAG
jgi:copper oxidase (laccase) domain-containing protein